MISPNILPQNKTLSLNAKPETSFRSFDTSSYFERLNGSHGDEYLLLIHDEAASKDYRLKFPGTKLIRDIKNDIYDLTSIPVRFQQWTGWPPNIDEESASLASSGIGKQHHLTVRKNVKDKERSSRSGSRAASESRMDDDRSSADEFEDASEAMLNDDDDFLEMIDIPSSSVPQTLIPADIDDNLAGVMSFCEEFTKRYGNCTPMFFQGTLEDALKESVQLPAKSRKLLAVYLHHDGSVSSNVFCSQVLCDISIVDYLSNNFIMWGWDLTHEANKARLLNLVMNHFGSMAATTVRNLSIEKLPALLIITRTRSTIEVLSIVHGNLVLDEVMTSLLHATEMFEEQRSTEVMEEDAREEREAMKAEQDAAYMASLEADRAKALARKQEEDTQRQERERQESARQQEEMIKEAVRASLETNIPEEPGPDCKEPVCRFRFRIPGGETINRSFLTTNLLRVSFYYFFFKIQSKFGSFPIFKIYYF